jgi:hypothetical protein
MKAVEETRQDNSRLAERVLVFTSEADLVLNVVLTETPEGLLLMSAAPSANRCDVAAFLVEPSKVLSRNDAPVEARATSWSGVYPLSIKFRVPPPAMLSRRWARTPARAGRMDFTASVYIIMQVCLIASMSLSIRKQPQASLCLIMWVVSRADDKQ